MRLRQRLKIRGIFSPPASAMARMSVLDWLRAGVPTPQLDVATLDDLLAAGATVERHRRIVSR